jgi:hypothetical protein
MPGKMERNHGAETCGLRYSRPTDSRFAWFKLAGMACENPDRDRSLDFRLLFAYHEGFSLSSPGTRAVNTTSCGAD